VKFLIVDDDPFCRELLRVILRPYGQCDMAADGEEALQAVRASLEGAEPYDLICLDIMMPGIDGHEVLRRVRELERRHGRQGSDVVNVVMTTALQDPRHCIQAFEEGCESYCTKPLTEEKILGEVSALLGDRTLAPIGRPAHSEARGPAEVAPSGAEQNLPPEACPLPEACSPLEDSQSRHSPRSVQEPAGQAPVAPQKRLRCLIVDDDRVCRELLRSMLEPHADCAFAYDGEEAVEAVRLALEDGTPYELICLDIMMPGMDGHQALERLRAVEIEHGRKGLDGAKVIMTTALRDPKHCVRSFREGCEAYTTKPIHEDELFAKIRELGLLTDSCPAAAKQAAGGSNTERP